MPDSPVQLHRAARLEQRLIGWRARRAREAGFTPVVIPYTGYGSTRWLRVLGRALLNRGRYRVTGEPAGARGWRSFTSVAVQYARVEVQVADQTFVVEADRNGVIDAVLDVASKPGWRRIGLRVEGSDLAPADVFVVDPASRFGLLSDIDDTVMVTALPRPLLAAWHTFVVNEHARSATPGLPVLYERLTDRHPGCPVIYLSTGAWNVAPTLTRFLSRNLYPAGALLLTDWGPTTDAWFRSGPQHKRTALDRLAGEFPQIRWLLVGDDGQHDEQIYTEFCERHPEQVHAVCIRQLSPGEAVLAGSNLRGRSRRDGSAAPWFYAPDGAGLAEQLEDSGLLADSPQQPEVQN